MHRRHFLRSAVAGLGVAGVGLSRKSKASAQAFRSAPNPYPANQQIYHCDLLIVGGSSAGTAAALTAGRLGIDTILVMRAPRDLGGLESNGLNPDSDILIRYVGGFSMEMDVLGRVTTGVQIEETKYVAPPHTVFRYIHSEFDKLPNVTILADYYVDAVRKQEQQITTVVFRHRKEIDRTITIYPKVTIDAEIEGDTAFLAGVSMTLKREGKVASDDPTRNLEYSAGEIYVSASRGNHAGSEPLPQSTFKADEVARTMAWSAILTIEKLGERSPDNPWLLTLPPAGYDPGAYQWMRGVGGVPLADNHYRFSSDQWLSYIEGWRMPNGKHVLESMNIADREENERKHIARTLGALYYGQHVLGRTEWGLSTKTFHEGFPAKYTLADFGTSTRMGDMPLPSLLYMREGRRMVNDHVFGGKFMEDQGTDAYCQKNYRHPRSFYFNAMNIDIHGVTNRFVEGSGPEGMQIARYVNRGFGVCCIPFDVCIPRPNEATGLLVASAGAYTHQAYSAFPRMEPGRFQIGAGCAMAAYTALRNGVPPHEADVETVQLRGLIESGHSIVFFDDAMPGTENHVIDQMLGARGVPLQNAQGIYTSETAFSNSEMLECIESFFLKYAENPVKRGRFDPITRILRENPNKRADWGTALPILAMLTKFDESGDFNAIVKRCSDAGYLKCGENPKAKTALHFSTFKKLLFNFAFSKKSPHGSYPVEGVSPFLRDTFNRKDGPVEKPEIGPNYVSSSPWEVKGGLTVPTQAEADSFLWTACKAKEFTAACDLFLEQTQTESTAGLAFRSDVENSYLRFVVRTDRFDVLILLERVTGESEETLAKKRRETKLRGFTLRAHRERDILYCMLGHETAFHVPFRESVFEVGLYNGSGNKNLFDNFEIINY